MKVEVASVDVTNVTITPTSASQKVGDTFALTATVEPNDATNKKVKWSVGGTNAGAVTLYSDQNCTTQVGSDATDILTVYAKCNSAGSAIVTVTSNADSTKTADCNVTVGKADLTAPSGLTATYGQTLADVTLPAGWTWVDNTQSVGSVGDHTFKANFVGDDNYNPAFNVDVTVTVGKADATDEMKAVSVTIQSTNGAAATVSYTLPDGAGFGTVTNSNTDYFTVSTSNGLVLTAAKTWTETEWAASIAKTFTVVVTNATNYNDYTLTVSVTPTYKPAQTITVDETITATYGDTGVSVSASVTIGEGTISYAVKSGDEEYIDVNPSTGALTIKKAGTATVVVKASETETFAQATKDVTVTINKKDVTVGGITASEKPYDGTTTATLDTGNVTFTGKLDADTMTVSGTGTFADANVGNSKIVTISGLTLGGVSAENYQLAAEGQQATVTANITAKEVGLTWSGTVLRYTGSPQKPSAEATGLVNGDTCTVTVTGEQTNVGENYTATAESLSNSNYKLPENKTTTFSISEDASSVTTTPTAKNPIYNAQAQELVTAGEAIGGTMQYALGTDTSTKPEDSAYSTTIPTGTEAETYYVWYKVFGDVNHSDTDPVPLTVTISADPFPLRVEIHNYTNTGTNGVPGDVPQTTLSLDIQIVDASGAVVSAVAGVPVNVMGGDGIIPKDDVTFDRTVDLSTGTYKIAAKVTPPEVTSAPPISQVYHLSTDAWVSEGGVITIYLKWDDGKNSQPEVIRVYALPEDEIGAYHILPDGTKEYLLFHTYNICMAWLGSDELCRGPERCFHKSSPYENPFVTEYGLIEEHVR
ncbi:MAG: Ig-like domain-containing protein [Anaerolineaceae bacterium]|nr:Ig-like domain-containing protein [Anaerolineaceae bacterium]